MDPLCCVYVRVRGSACAYTHLLPRDGTTENNESGEAYRSHAPCMNTVYTIICLRILQTYFPSSQECTVSSLSAHAIAVLRRSSPRPSDRDRRRSVTVGRGSDATSNGTFPLRKPETSACSACMLQLW